MDPLFRELPDLDPSGLGNARFVSYRARDGLEIPAVLTLPASSPEGPQPTVVVPHGGPHARDTLDFDAETQFLASRGYAVLRPNFRGSTGYGRRHLQASFGEWGRAMQQDVADGVSWLVAQGIADPKRIAILGASYGGYAALQGSATTPDLYRCAISWAGISDLNLLLRQRDMWIRGRPDSRWIGHWLFDRSKLASVSPLKSVERIRVPILLIHGEYDSVVIPRHSKRMAKALKKAGKKHEYLELPREWHYTFQEENRMLAYQRIEKFLDSCLAAPEDSPPANGNAP
ncbi:MAG: alpha/beta fold hydrolase [Proteobacteria bacterium]|nr:alpha/beta fold hydrolase [Pseudomonadota bacterium]